jgi:hypothetical protein
MIYSDARVPAGWEPLSIDLLEAAGLLSGGGWSTLLRDLEAPIYYAPGRSWPLSPLWVRHLVAAAISLSTVDDITTSLASIGQRSLPWHHRTALVSISRRLRGYVPASERQHEQAASFLIEAVATYRVGGDEALRILLEQPLLLR